MKTCYTWSIEGTNPRLPDEITDAAPLLPLDEASGGRRQMGSVPRIITIDGNGLHNIIYFYEIIASKITICRKRKKGKKRKNKFESIIKYKSNISLFIKTRLL